MFTLNPYRAFPLTPFGASLEPFDPFFSTASPFALLPALTQSLGAFDEMPRVDATAEDKSLRVTFPGDLGSYEHVDVSIDPANMLLVLKASSADGRSRTSRVVSLPCAIQNADKVVAEIDSRGAVVVTVPAECQKQLTNESLRPKPSAGDVAPTADTGKSAQPRKLKVNRPPGEEKAKTPEFEVHDDDVGFSIAVHHVAPEDVSVFADGNLLHVSCKAAGGDGTAFSRNFELPRKIVNAKLITADVTICQQHQDEAQHSRLDIAVPKDALEPEPKPKLPSAISIPVKVKQAPAA